MSPTVRVITTIDETELLLWPTGGDRSGVGLNSAHDFRVQRTGSANGFLLSSGLVVDGRGIRGVVGDVTA